MLGALSVRSFARTLSPRPDTGDGVCGQRSARRLLAWRCSSDRTVSATVRSMLVVKNELERFQRDTDALARGDSRFLRVAVRGAGVQPEHLESALGLLLALTSISMSDEGRRTLKVIELAVDSTGSRTDDVAAVRANLIRALVAGGFSAFERSEQWLDADGPDEVVNTRWAKVKRNLRSDLAFIEAVGVDPDVYTQIQRASLYFSSRTMPDTNVRGARSLLGSHLLLSLIHI